MAARFCAAVARVEVDGCRLGIDIGMASFRVDGGTEAGLLRVAEERIYDQKHQGRAHHA